MKLLSNPRTIVIVLSANFLVLVSLFVWLFTSYLRPARSEGYCNDEYLSKTVTNKLLPSYEYIAVDGENAYENLIKGRVLLVFLSSECAACQKEVMFLSEHFQEISNKQIKIVGVTTENRKKTDSFSREYKLQFPIVIDRDGGLMFETGVRCTPTNFILENGIVKKIHFGTFDNLEQVVESL